MTDAGSPGFDTRLAALAETPPTREKANAWLARLRSHLGLESLELDADGVALYRRFAAVPT